MYGKKFFATGKRKTSIARVWMEPGEGKFIINKRPMGEYFNGLNTLQAVLKQPLELTESLDKYDIYANVQGGGISGQTGAIRHAIAKALLLINPEFRNILNVCFFNSFIKIKYIQHIE